MNSLQTEKCGLYMWGSEHNQQAIPLLIDYYIPDDRRRNRLNRLLRGFGEPIHKSAFICWVDPARRRRLESILEDFRCAARQGGERIECVNPDHSPLQRG